MKVLMICLGNICRSPLAEGILKYKLQQNGNGWYVDSAGIGGWHAGELPDRRSIAIAKKRGIDITDQRARKFQPADLDNFDLILAMDEENYDDLMRTTKTEKQRQKIDLIMHFSRPNSQTIVPDPYYDNRFELVFDLLNEACDEIVKKYT
jgi:protein-tyrosine phosphatase